MSVVKTTEPIYVFLSLTAVPNATLYFLRFHPEDRPMVVMDVVGIVPQLVQEHTEYGAEVRSQAVKLGSNRTLTKYLTKGESWFPHN